MKPVQAPLHNSRLLFSTFVVLLFCSFSLAVPSVHDVRNSNPLNINWDPAPAPEDGPPASANALRDPTYLPYQVGAIVGSYGLSLVLVAVLLLVLSKRRREALSAGDNEIDFDEPKSSPPLPKLTLEVPASPRSIPRSPVRNFSYPSPEEYQTPELPTPQTPYIAPTPTSTLHAPGIDVAVDQRVVAKDKRMAQSQLEEMYKYVMEHEEAKAQGITLQGSPVLASNPQMPAPANASLGKPPKKEKHKPANLNLVAGSDKPEKQSRASSIFSALRSPKKNKHPKGISISSPIMTPMTGTFPRQESQEMNAIPPRQYAPPPPPPVPTNQVPYGLQQNNGQVSPITPDRSPESTQSIDERIGGQIPLGHVRKPSAAPSGYTVSEVDPNSAVSERSTAPLIGLPQSPKPGARFPTNVTLPSSPKPGATFPSSPQLGATFRSKAPSAVRTGGALPLRAYEPAPSSPSLASQTTKQTVFTRTGPLSPSGARTPATGMAVPYSPYQPFTPCVPMTPSLVTKADRKRMRKLEPKTPTLEMVKSDDDIW
ncbi:hypothetical protein Cob_v001759 [Colletotrichum orbiculare MAFF 240422]|uniref:Rna polymerase ii transcription initiation nucleotide excision repair factor tfiih n=1 Tax=Colletotrichum orbiculare (strain 104-T / ATCC 96160 / CBS 514.97 / LARS 414 / MAFF 240422) TaxID=1213857 RepID=N4UY33_COLOR|nr:hypothetical protein Cob_v001759 [Colletotrichum orbiculare MAFF 240422]